VTKFYAYEADTKSATIKILNPGYVVIVSFECPRKEGEQPDWKEEPTFYPTLAEAMTAIKKFMTP